MTAKASAFDVQQWSDDSSPSLWSYTEHERGFDSWYQPQPRMGRILQFETPAEAANDRPSVARESNADVKGDTKSLLCLLDQWSAEDELDQAKDEFWTEVERNLRAARQGD